MAHCKSTTIPLLLGALWHLLQLSDATYGSYYSYTATNHLAHGLQPQYAIYKSPSFSSGYQYSYLPPVYTTHSVWPAVSTVKTYIKAPVVYEPAFTAPCSHGHLSSFSHVIRPLIGPPVKTKPNNATEHVYKPIYYPFAWGYHQPLFAYQGTIQHMSMPPKEETAKTEATKSEATMNTATDAKKGELEMEEADEKTEAPTSEAPAAAEEETSMEMAETAEPAKTKRDAVSIAKSFGARKKNKRKSA